MDRHLVDNGAGWKIALKRTAKAGVRGRPVLIVPGYGMNSFIFGFHPTGQSMEEHLASRGLEVWSVDLRGQGQSVRDGGSDAFGMGELAVDDVGAAIARVLDATKTGATQVDLVGCSLGAALSFAHVACVPGAPVGSLVSLGGLVTWVKVHPALRVAFASPWLVGKVNVRHTRAMAGLALPVIARFAPALLKPYMNASSTDVSRASEMVQTVEDPNTHMNRQIAHWVNERDLVVRGVDVSRAVASMKLPFLCVVAAHDGIVPVETARWPYDAIGSTDKQLVMVGDDQVRIAHADLFISRVAEERVFRPLADFLLSR
jgi:pimeloyl-ACP methyl ester carboxylesterase